MVVGYVFCKVAASRSGNSCYQYFCYFHRFFRLWWFF